MTRTFLAPTDSMFLYGDTTETPMHIGALMPFEPATDAPADFLRQLYESMRDRPVVAPWNQRLATHRVLQSPLHWWVEDDKIDLEYHVRRSALPSPGDERELGILVARLHSHPLDLSRPPWELHIIEGLADGRFAIYTKMHHALVDGISGMRMLARSLSANSADRDTSMFFSMPLKRERSAERQEPAPAPSLPSQIMNVTSGAAALATNTTRSMATLTRALGHLAVSRFRGDESLVAFLQAPQSILGARITPQRRFATQQYSVSRLKRIARATGTTLNDVVMAICGGGLRTYLSELDALPDRPLIGFLPVNIRTSDDSGGGNAVGAVLATMGSDIAEPLERLRAVHASTTKAKEQMRGMGQATSIAYSGALLAPSILQSLSAITGLPGSLVTANLCVSNVPGPSQSLYLAGARLQAIYPLSIPAHGMALNITVESYADTLGFGFIGCRDTLPHLQRLAVHTGEALTELESALEAASAE